MNPSFGLSKFHSENIWWYSRWLLGMPVDYYVGLALSLLVCMAGARARDKIGSQAREWSGTVVALAALTLLTIAVTPF